MICYRDRTFCSHSSCPNPDRQLSESVKNKAEQWWGVDAPIAVSPLCISADNCDYISNKVS